MPAHMTHRISPERTARLSFRFSHEGRRGCLAVLLLVALLPVAPALTASGMPSPPDAAPGYRLVFNEEFDDLDISPDGAGLHTWYEGVWFRPKHAPLSN